MIYLAVFTLKKHSRLENTHPFITQCRSLKKTTTKQFVLSSKNTSIFFIQSNEQLRPGCCFDFYSGEHKHNKFTATREIFVIGTQLCKGNNSHSVLLCSKKLPLFAEVAEAAGSTPHSAWQAALKYQSQSLYNREDS